MSVKPRRQLLMRSDDRVVIYACLFLVCAILSSMGLGAVALLCFLPAAALFEGLSKFSVRKTRSDNRSLSCVDCLSS